MVTRRTFLAYTGGTALTLFAYDRFGIKQALAAIAGGTLDPVFVPKFQTPLLVPPVMPKARTILQMGGKNIDCYEISMKQISQQILPASLPAPKAGEGGQITRVYDQNGVEIGQLRKFDLEVPIQPTDILFG